MHDMALPSSGYASGAGDACLFGLSLCSGAGGLDLGLTVAIPGYRAVGHVERETYAAATLVARMEDASLDRAALWDDVGTFDGRPWRGAVDILSAGYLPEKLIIRLGTEIRIIDTNGTPVPFPTPAAFAVFMHEYMHYLHNISTACGLSGFVNTLELWRLFRRTIDPTGFSVGSSQLDGATQEHLERLMHVLVAGKIVRQPPLRTVVTPVSVEILSTALEDKVEDDHGALLSTFACEAEIRDDRGTAERCRIEIGIPEIMEAAAWLLERRLASALAPDAAESPVPVFPYKLVSALAEHLLPGIADETVLACTLAALQSSDPADGLQQVLRVAKEATNEGRDPLDAIRNAVAEAVITNESTLLQCLSGIEAEFAGKDLWRQIGEPHHSADEPVGDLLGRGNVLDGGSGAGFQLTPPVPGAGNCAQHMRILRPAIPQGHIVGRQDFRPPVAFADRQRNDDPDGVTRAGHAQASVWRGAIMSRRTELSPSWRRSTAMPSSPTVTRSTRSWTMRVCSAG
jgi:hypothetical protein